MRMATVLGPAVPPARGLSHFAELRQRLDPLPKAGAQRCHVGAAIGPDEPARRQEAGNQEHIDLTGVVKHQVCLIDRREPAGHRAHANRVAAGPAGS